jgi:hypothetical protein
MLIQRQARYYLHPSAHEAAGGWVGRSLSKFTKQKENDVEIKGNICIATACDAAKIIMQ